MILRKYFFLSFILVVISCDRQLDIKYKSQLECLTSLEKQIISKKRILNFNETVNCFDWDSLKVENLGDNALREYFDFRYKVVNDSARRRMENNGKVDIQQYEYWNYIFFFNKGIRLKDALAIHDHDLYLTTYDINSKIGRNDAVFSIGFKNEKDIVEMHFKDTLLYNKY